MPSFPVLNALVGQFSVILDLQTNLKAIGGILQMTHPGDLVVLPEGALSGYDEDPAFLCTLNPRQIEVGVAALAQEAKDRQLHLFFGTCLFESGQWFNVGLYLGPRGERFTYRKVNLATRERGHFTAGTLLTTLDIQVGEQTVRVGLQLCRELRYPEQWQFLARQGAQVIIYMTNAVGDASEFPIWRAHLMSRAAENQRFILSSNNAQAAQKCPTLVVAPTGHVLTEAPSPAPTALRAALDLSLVSDWYLNQARQDVVSVTAPAGAT